MKSAISLIILVLMTGFFSPVLSQPIDGVVESSFAARRPPALPYQTVREADILWEKRIWRVIDTREKMNLPFRYEEEPFFSILMKGIESGAIQAYSPENDAFTQPMTGQELSLQLFERDTITIVDPVTYEETLEVVENAFNPQEIIRYRIKEVWYFDTRLSAMRVRILGIAPLRQVRGEEGEVRYETPLFWVYYPDCRQWLSDFPVFNEWNNRQVMSWEDWLEMRFFSSYIYKESNIFDRRLQDYLAGREILEESERIKQEIFNYEQDMWSY